MARSFSRTDVPSRNLIERISPGLLPVPPFSIRLSSTSGCQRKRRQNSRAKPTPHRPGPRSPCSTTRASCDVPFLTVGSEILVPYRSQSHLSVVAKPGRGELGIEETTSRQKVFEIGLQMFTRAITTRSSFGHRPIFKLQPWHTGEFALVRGHKKRVTPARLCGD